MKSFRTMTKKAYSLAKRHFGEQGVWTTLLWVYGRGLPALTGVPILHFCQITPNLYVGSQYRKQGLHHLENNGINAVVNMRKEYNSAIHGLAPQKYCYLPTVDDTAPSIEDIRKGVLFIQQSIAAGEKVYIHCGAGVGRAPTMAASYLMSTGLTLDQALAKIRAVRPFIYIMPPQMEFLRRYEVYFPEILNGAAV
jgi:protein-tyrosine phosphatase